MAVLQGGWETGKKRQTDRLTRPSFVKRGSKRDQRKMAAVGRRSTDDWRQKRVEVFFRLRGGFARLLGTVQYDNDRSRFSDELAGVTYESCCYGLSIYGRSYYNELDSTDKPTRAIMAEISLNGISNRRSGRLSGLMSDRVLGYNQLQSF